jgi:hypothetical protein
MMLPRLWLLLLLLRLRLLLLKKVPNGEVPVVVPGSNYHKVASVGYKR